MPRTTFGPDSDGATFQVVREPATGLYRIDLDSDGCRLPYPDRFASLQEAQVVAAALAEETPVPTPVDFDGAALPDPLPICPGCGFPVDPEAPATFFFPNDAIEGTEPFHGPCGRQAVDNRGDATALRFRRVIGVITQNRGNVILPAGNREPTAWGVVDQAGTIMETWPLAERHRADTAAV